MRKVFAVGLAAVLAFAVVGAVQYANLNTDTFELDGGIYRTLANGSAVLVQGPSKLSKMLDVPNASEFDMTGIGQDNEGDYFLKDLVLPEEDIPESWSCKSIAFDTQRCCSQDGNECELFVD